MTQPRTIISALFQIQINSSRNRVVVVVEPRGRLREQIRLERKMNKGRTS